MSYRDESRFAMQELDGQSGSYAAGSSSGELFARKRATDPSRLGFHTSNSPTTSFDDTREYEPREILMPSKVRRLRSPEKKSIGEVMTQVYFSLLSEKNRPSEKLIYSLVARLKKAAQSFSLDGKQLQMLVEKFLNKLIADKNWSAMSAERALLLCATTGEDSNDNLIEDCDWFECSFCELSHPPGRYQCSICGEKFPHQVFLQAHKMTAHNSAAVIRGTVLQCPGCDLDFNEDPRQLAIHIREKHMCPYNHIECPRSCGELIVERHVDSVLEHITEKHECSVCHDPVTKSSVHVHLSMFHGISRESVTDEATKVVRKVEIDKDLPKGYELTVQRDLTEEEQISSAGNESGADLAEDPEHAKFSTCTSCTLRVPFGGFKCPDCSQMFVYRAQLFIHFKEFHRKSSSFSLFCEICGKLCSNVNALMMHIVKESHCCSSEHLQCSYGCSEMFPTLSDLALHNDEQHEFYCPSCKTVVAVTNRRAHIRDCQKGLATQNMEGVVEENKMEKCQKCPFVCPQSVAYMCELCPQGADSPSVVEFVDEIEWMGHILKSHKDRSGPFRQKTLSCSLCPKDTNEDSFDILSFLHHRKVFHSVCDTHVRCPNRPCNAIVPIDPNDNRQHLRTDCPFKFDIRHAKCIPVEKPTWKACKSCSYAVFVDTMLVCDQCPSKPVFVTSTEFILHMSKFHAMLTHLLTFCALCRTDFTTQDEFELHRSVFHEFCHHHLQCNPDCMFLFASEIDVSNHSRLDAYCALKVPHGRKNRTKFCNVCSAVFKLDLIDVCFFCDERPLFVSENEFLLHLLETHGRRVAGHLECADCQQVFEEPLAWSEHSASVHMRCRSHRFCPNSVECYTAFPNNERMFAHACNYEKQMPLSMNPILPLPNASRPLLHRPLSLLPEFPQMSSTLGRFEMQQPIRNLSTFVPQLISQPAGSSSLQAFVPLKYPILRTPEEQIDKTLGRSTVKDRLGRKQDSNDSTISSNRFDIKAKTEEKQVIGREKISLSQKQKLYEKLLTTSRKVFYCISCLFESNHGPEERSKCDQCEGVWYLYNYELHVHKSEAHGIEYVNEGSETFECDICDAGVFVTDSPKAMSEHKKAAHNFSEKHLVCPKKDCTRLFDSEDGVKKHCDYSTKPHRCLQLFREDFAWQYKLKSGSIVKSIQSVRRQLLIMTCSRCPIEIKVTNFTTFADCKKCVNEPMFALDVERFWHMLAKHNTKIGLESSLCLHCDDPTLFSVTEKAEHRQKVHGFCCEHFKCRKLNCYFITSDIEEYRDHVNSCKDCAKPQNCRLLPIDKPRGLKEDDSREQPCNDFTSGDAICSSKPNADELNSSKTTDCDLAEESQQEMESSSQSNWDDMMTNMIQYTDELINQKEGTN